MCSLHLPLDDKVQLRVLVEAEAALGLIALCEAGQAILLSSAALEYEAGRNPNPVRRAYAQGLLAKAGQHTALSPDVEQRTEAFNLAGLRPLDALHLASAIQGGANYFCTCDDRLLKRARAIHSGPPKLVTPLELIADIQP